MSWDAIGAVGQMLGSLAVFITLGYLGIQIRDTRQESRRSMRESRTESAGQIMISIAQSEWLNNVQVKRDRGLGGRDIPIRAMLIERGGLTDAEANAAMVMESVWWLALSQQIAHVDDLTHGERVEFERSIAAKYGSSTQPLSPMWYQDRKSGLNPDIVRYIDNLLAQPVASAS